MVILCIIGVICYIIAALSPLIVLYVILFAITKKELSEYQIVIGILAILPGVIFYGSILGFTFSVDFQVLAIVFSFLLLLGLCSKPNSK